ncbi:MAG TPA: hypothetical protein VGG25_26135 [Streptosporangiaceae bacterium]
MLAIAAHLVLAPVAAILTCCALAVARLSRWHPLWLAVPAGAGAIAVAAVGTGRALAGFAAAPRQVIGDLSGAAGHPGRLAHLPAAVAGTGHLLAAQLPVALLLSSAEAALAGWLVRRARAGRGRRAWSGAGGSRMGGAAGQGTSDGAVPSAGWRPGLIVMARRRMTAAGLAAGHAVTREGGAVGLDPASGRPVAVTWAQAEGGVLTVASTSAAALLAGFPLAAAAIARRKALIVIDLAGSPWLPRSLAAVCGSVGVPLSCRGGPRLSGQPPVRPGSAGVAEEAKSAAPAVGMQEAIRDRAVVLFSAGPAAGPGAAATGRQAVTDLMTLLGELGAERLRADSLAWVICRAGRPGDGDEGDGDGGDDGWPALAGLAALGSAAGTAVLLSTASPADVTSLGQAVRVVLASGPLDQELTRRLAALALFRAEDDRQAAAELLRWQDEDEFAVIGPAGRLRTGCRQVPAPAERQP